MPLNSVVPDSLVANIAKTENSFAEMVQEGRFEDLGNYFITWGIDFVSKLAIALVLFFVGRWVIRQVKKVIDKVMFRRKVEPTLREFLRNLINIALYVILVVLIVNVVGTQTVSIAAIIGSAGLAIGLSVKDNLANFAGGVMLLFNKPFRAGDFIEAQEMSGTVQSIGILYTILTTADNKTIYIPNGPLSTGNIINYNTQLTRRTDIVVNIDYGADVEMIKSLLLNIAHAHPQVLKTPEPFARMTKMNDSSIDFTLRAWADTEDYWNVTHDLNEEIYKQLTQRGINIPFPQMTVHLAKD